VPRWTDVFRFAERQGCKSQGLGCATHSGLACFWSRRESHDLVSRSLRKPDAIAQAEWTLWEGCQWHTIEKLHLTQPSVSVGAHRILSSV